MKCHERETLFLFVHQMLDPHEAEGMRQHVAGCAECRRAAEKYGRLDAALDDWSGAEPSPWFDAKVRERVARSAHEDPEFFGFGRVRALMAGMAAIVLIVGALVVFHHRQVAENHQSAISRQQPEATAAPPEAPERTEAQRRPLPAAEQLKMDENLSLLEDYDVVSNFDALSELPQANDN
jgi:anti-sigma factor RsiW